MSTVTIDNTSNERLRTAVSVTARTLLKRIDEREREYTELEHLPFNAAEQFIRQRRIDQLRHECDGLRLAAAMLAGSLQLNGWQDLRKWLGPER